MLTVREMNPEDSIKIAELEQSIFSDAWTQRGIEETFSQQQAMIVVAEEEQKILGYCILYTVLDEAEIARIAVCEERRHLGTGSKILESCEKICAAKGVKRLLLDVRESNEAARRFYEKHGFQKDGIRKRFYENPCEDAVLMSKEIS